MYQYRLDRVQQELVQRGIDALITCDPVNTRYATGIRNMQVWAFHSIIRLGLIPAQGKAIVFEYAGSEHLAKGLETIEYVVPSIPLHFGPGLSQEQKEEKLRQWTTLVVSELKKLGIASGGRLALDNQMSYTAGQALANNGYDIENGYGVLAAAQSIKNEDEIRAMYRSVQVAEIGIERLEQKICPGISENELWAELNAANIEYGGEYMDTRLLSSGPRTNPWYQECSDRQIESGDLVALDTDMIGPYGYDADISRTFFCGSGAASAAQKECYKVAYDHVQHNLNLLKPGMTFKELSEKAFQVPEKYRAQSIDMNWHGVSLYGGWPTILGRGCFNSDSEDGEVVPGMTLCVESYCGEVGGRDGVKLEEQVLITEDGIRLFSQYPFDSKLLS